MLLLQSHFLLQREIVTSTNRASSEKTGGEVRFVKPSTLNYVSIAVPSHFCGRCSVSASYSIIVPFHGVFSLCQMIILSMAVNMDALLSVNDPPVGLGEKETNMTGNKRRIELSLCSDRGQ